MYSKILIASDGSSPSMNAANVAAAMAKAFSGSLTVATVAYLPKPYEGDIGADMREGYLEEWKGVLENTVKTVKQHDIEPEAKLLRGEEPVKALLKEVERGQYDLLVVGRTGAGRPGSRMMGGVSRRLAEGATCAVLLVR